MLELVLAFKRRRLRILDWCLAWCLEGRASGILLRCAIGSVVTNDEDLTLAQR